MSCVENIKKQGGLVYIPHPFDWRRSSLLENELTQIIKFVDIIEVFNARSIPPGENKNAISFFLQNKIAPAAGSDAHSANAVGKSLNLIKEKPNVKNLVKLLKSGQRVQKPSKPWNLFTLKINKVKKKISRNEFT